MENLTINQAMIKLADLEKIYNNKMRILSTDSSTTISYILELTGDRHDCSEPFPFEEEFKSVIELSNTINKIKTTISKANNNTLINIDGEECSIQECLNFLKTARDQVRTFENIVTYTKASKNRRVDAAGTSPYYKVTELNFDKVKMQNYVEELNAKILKFELAVNEANNKTVITIV